MSSITPTIGRKVWYWTTNASRVRNSTQGIDATVIFIGDDDLVDLQCVDHHGEPFIAQNIVLGDYLDEGDPPVHGVDNFATWMPYQMGQAKKEAASTNSSVTPTGNLGAKL